MQNIVAKWEISGFEQFLLLSLCFQNAVCCRGVFIRERDKQNQTLAILIDNKPPLIQTYFESSVADNFWKQCAKDKIAHNEQFLLLSQWFKLYSIIILRLIQIFVQIFSMSSVVDMLYVGKGQCHMLEPMTWGLLSVGKCLFK